MFDGGAFDQKIVARAWMQSTEWDSLQSVWKTICCK